MMDSASRSVGFSTIGREDHALWPRNLSSSIPSLFVVAPLTPTRLPGLLCSLYPQLPFSDLISLLRVLQNDTLLPLAIKTHPRIQHPAFQSSFHSWHADGLTISFIAIFTTPPPLHWFAKINLPLFMLYNSNERILPPIPHPPSLFHTLIGHKHSSGARCFLNTIASFSFLHSDYCCIH